MHIPEQLLDAIFPIELLVSPTLLEDDEKGLQW